MITLRQMQAMVIKKMERLMPAASGYSISLLCDICNYTTQEFGGSERKTDIWRMVRRAGWSTKRRDGSIFVICPKCKKKLINDPPAPRQP